MVTIKGMKMPRWCGECPMCIEETIEDTTITYCAILNHDITWNGNRVDDCPLVEIITCKDCDNRCTGGLCTKHDIIVTKDFYCADAERRV